MGPLILFLTTFIWGTAFLAQKFGAETLGPFAMTCLRNVLGGAFLLACIAVRNRRGRGGGGGSRWRADFHSILHLNLKPQPRLHLHLKSPPSLHLNLLPPPVFAGICCGVPLFFAMLTQQIGIGRTSPGICAFLTTNYVLIVPVGAALLSRKLPPFYVWVGVVFALLGTYFISIDGETLSVGPGEAWTLLCALLFSVQMLTVDRFAKRVDDLLAMSAAQLLTCAAIGLPCLLLPSERPLVASFLSSLASRPSELLPVFYCGVFSSGIAYTLQNVGQAKTPAGLAAILLSMESVFGALSGYVVLGDRLSARQFLGCALVFLASVATSLLSAKRDASRPGQPLRRE